MNDNIDLSKIPIFLAVVKKGSFTEAAYDLFMTQSGVSKAIAALEDSVGFTLFLRDSRKITLTPEGACLYKKFTSIMQDVDQAVISAKNVHSGDFGTVSIGSSGFLPKTPAFERVCSEFSLVHNGFDIDMHYLPYSTLRKKLIEESLDMILFNTHDLEMLHGFSYLPIMKGECILCYNKLIPPLTDSGKTGGALTIEDFADRPFICLNRDLVPSYYDYLSRCCKAYGFTPNIVKYTDSLQALIHYINISKYVSIFDRTLFPVEDPDIKYISIEHKDEMAKPMETALVWKKGNQNPVLDSFTEFAADLIKEDICDI